MREILFKAKRLDNGEWFEGVPVNVTPIQCFAEPQREEVLMVRAGFADWGMPRGLEGTKVDPTTVCQYTGLTDKNGVKIFEGDVVNACLDPEVVEGEVKFEDKISCFCIIINDRDFTTFLDYRIAKNKVNDRVWIEVIGNIHDKED